MDGLLLDTETEWREAQRELFERHGATFVPADHRAILGTSEDVTNRFLARRLGRGEEASDAIRDEYVALVLERFERGVRPLPGAVELLASLAARVPLAIASNSRRAMVELALLRAGVVGPFAAIVTCEDVVDPKPAPDIYLLACERLGVRPSDALAVEDSPTGVRSARAAGLTCIQVPADAQVDVSAADRVVGSLLELVAARD